MPVSVVLFCRTVIVHSALTVPSSLEAAVMTAVPSLTAVTTPFALTVAIFSSEEDQTMERSVRFHGVTKASRAVLLPL